MFSFMQYLHNYSRVLSVWTVVKTKQTMNQISQSMKILHETFKTKNSWIFFKILVVNILSWEKTLSPSLRSSRT